MAKTTTSTAPTISIEQHAAAVAAVDHLFDTHYDPKRTDRIVNTVLEALGLTVDGALSEPVPPAADPA